MDVHLIIVDFTKHQKGFSVQRCEAAVRGSLTREFGPAVPFLFYAPPWVAQYLSSPQQVQLARGVPDVIQLVTDRIARLGREHTNAAPRVLVASYNFYARRAAREAGASNGVAVGTIQLADYANGFFPQRAVIEWSGAETSSLGTTVAVTPDERRGYYQDRGIENQYAVPAPPANDNVNQPPPVTPAELIPAAAADDKPGLAEPEKYPRSRQMRASVQKAKLFNEKPIRDLLFKTVTQIVTRERLQLSALRRTLAEESFAHSDFSDKMKWAAQVYFFCRLLVFSGTLQGSSGPLSHGAAADGTEVQEISSTVEDDAEAYLIEHIIRDLGNVTEFEHCPLAHAILRQFDSTTDMGVLKDRVAFLISKISDRVTLDESGAYIHRVSKPSLRAVK